MKKFIPLISSCLLLLLFFYFFISWQDLFKIIKKTSVGLLILQIILSILYITLNSFFSKVLLSSLNLNLPFEEWIGLGFVNALSNYILPAKSGTLIKAKYLNSKYNFSLSHSASLLIFSSYISLGILILLTTLLVPIYNQPYERNLPYSDEIYMVFIAILIMFFISLVFMGKYKLNKIEIIRTYRIGNMVYLIFEGFNHAAQKFTTILSILSLSGTIIFVYSLRLFIGFLTFDAQPDFIFVALVSCLQSLSGLVAIAPGNLGAQEIIISFLSRLGDYSLTEGIAVAMQIRAAELFVTLTIGSYFTWRLNLLGSFKIKTYGKRTK